MLVSVLKRKKKKKNNFLTYLKFLARSHLFTYAIFLCADLPTVTSTSYVRDTTGAAELVVTNHPATNSFVSKSTKCIVICFVPTLKGRCICFSKKIKNRRNALSKCSFVKVVNRRENKV